MTTIPHHPLLDATRRCRRVAVSILVLLLAFLGITLAGVVAIDPYGERDLRRGVYYWDAPTTVPRLRRILARAETPYTVVFGTSRAFLFGDEFEHAPVVNMHALYGSPVSVNHFLRGLTEAELRGVGRIVYVIDLHTFNKFISSVTNYYESPLDRLFFHVLHFPQSVGAAIERVRFNLWQTAAFFPLHERGFQIQSVPKVWGGEKHRNLDAAYMSFDAEVLDKLVDIKEFTAQHGIEIEFITPTLPVETIQALDADALVALRRQILNRIGEYKELTYVRGISDARDNFYDDTHLNADGMRRLYQVNWLDFSVKSNNADIFFNNIVAIHAARRDGGR